MTSRVLFGVKRLLDTTWGVGPVLGIDTGGRVASVAVTSRGEVKSELVRAPGTHGAALADMVVEALAMAGCQLAELRAVAVALGPGSFTGLRVGLAYAKGLSTAANIPLVGVPSLDAIAVSACQTLSLAPGTRVCPLLDARRSEFYMALYRVGSNGLDGLEKLTDDLVVGENRLAAYLASENLVVISDFDQRAMAVGLGTGNGAVKWLTADELPARATYVAARGGEGLISGTTVGAASLQPIYGRAGDAIFIAANNAVESVWKPEKKCSFSSSPAMTRN